MILLRALDPSKPIRRADHRGREVAARNFFGGREGARRAADHVEDRARAYQAEAVDEKALLAGEMSGHLFFADRYFGSTTESTRRDGWRKSVSRLEHPLHVELADLPPVYNTRRSAWTARTM